MQVVTKLDTIKETIKEIKKKGMTVGFVPTMGFLHEGHLSLVRTASEETDDYGIFVNPCNSVSEDFERYP